MKYASTCTDNNGERVVVILDLASVPSFDPENPHPFTYGVDDDVQLGWIKDDTGKFIEPPTKQ